SSDGDAPDLIGVEDPFDELSAMGSRRVAEEKSTLEADAAFGRERDRDIHKRSTLVLRPGDSVNPRRTDRAAHSARRELRSSLIVESNGLGAVRGNEKRVEDGERTPSPVQTKSKPHPGKSEDPSPLVDNRVFGLYPPGAREGVAEPRELGEIRAFCGK